jgi:hypothetical protein
VGYYLKEISAIENKSFVWAYPHGSCNIQTKRRENLNRPSWQQPNDKKWLSLQIPTDNIEWKV